MSSLDVRAIDEDGLREEPCPPTKQLFRVFLSEEAFDRAVERGATDTTREIGGVLVGELLRDEAGPYLKIESTVDALHAEEKGAELTFTHATWEHINKEMDSQHKTKKVVGWYHTHPGFGVFLSDRDQFIHKSFFNLPFQVAFVYDPKTKEHGMFTWHDNEIVRARRYWVGPREQQWDGPRTAADPREARREPERTDAAAKPAASEDPGMGSMGSIISLVLLGLALLLIGGFGGHWLGASSGNRAIVEAQVEIAKAKQEGAQRAIATLQSELVGILRETLGDAAVRKPVLQTIKELDATIASLGDAPAAAGSAAGSAAPTGDERTQKIVAQLKTTRDSLVRLSEDRGSAHAVLAQLEMASRHGGELRRDLAQDLAEQRAGLAALYAEVAADVAKAGDKSRARRLLVLAARLDPGNRTRYEKQLQAFDKSASLPGDPGKKSGSGGTP